MTELTREDELLYLLYWIRNTLNDPDEVKNDVHRHLAALLFERNLVLKEIEKYLFSNGAYVRDFPLLGAQLLASFLKDRL